MEPEGSLRIYKRPPSAPILSQINPVHASKTISWKSILILSSTLHLVLPSGLFFSCFLTKTCHIYTQAHMRIIEAYKDCIFLRFADRASQYIYLGI